jgi:hypothetical protein
MIIAIVKYQLQALADDTALKREHQQAELALRERILERCGTSEEALQKILALGLISRETKGSTSEPATSNHSSSECCC